MLAGLASLSKLIPTWEVTHDASRYTDRAAAFGQYGLERGKKPSVGSRAVVSLERVDLLVDRDSSPPDGHCRVDHDPLPTQLEVGPIYSQNGPLDPTQQSLGHRAIDAVPLGMEMAVAQQPVQPL